jgi:hypothetical protein
VTGGGKILLLGVDQDRNTALHTAEALVRAPYLRDIEATYVDDDGREVTIPVALMAGPHRNLLGFDRLLRERGATRIGRIGKAVCRLIEAGPMVQWVVEELRRDPAAALCDNPACVDCVLQRGKIKAARLASEDFILAAVADEIAEDWEEVATALRGEGIAAVEVGAGYYQRAQEQLARSGLRVVGVRGEANDESAATLAMALSVPLVVPATDSEGLAKAAARQSAQLRVVVENRGIPSSDHFRWRDSHPNGPQLAFNPGEFAAAGERPFLGVFRKPQSRRQMERCYVDDMTSDGHPALPGRGNGEVKEIISMLRCRSFGGVICLRSHRPGVEAFREVAAAFWHLLDTM